MVFCRVEASETTCTAIGIQEKDTCKAKTSTFKRPHYSYILTQRLYPRTRIILVKQRWTSLSTLTCYDDHWARIQCEASSSNHFFIIFYSENFKDSWTNMQSCPAIFRGFLNQHAKLSSSLPATATWYSHWKTSSSRFGLRGRTDNRIDNRGLRSRTDAEADASPESCSRHAKGERSEFVLWRRLY